MLLLLSMVAAAAQVPTAPADKKDDPVICTRQHVGDEVGTRIQPKKYCMKKSDREYIDQQNKQTVQKLVNDGDDRMRFIPQPGH
jgi:hypothetical protein